MASTYPTSLDSFTNPLATNPLTSPSHAQQHSDINDAMEAVQTKLAIGNTVLGTYTAYTPTIGAFTLGDGTLTSSYCRVNDLVHYFGRIVVGATSAFPGGSFTITYPVNLDSAIAAATGTQVGLVSFRDISASTTYYGNGRTGASSATLFFVEVFNASSTYATGTNITGSVPMTWATGDILSWNIYYKAA
jgi:hypothetical protein